MVARVGGGPPDEPLVASALCAYLNDASERVLQGLVPDPPRPCFMFPNAEENRLLVRLLRTQMAVAVSETEISRRPDGRLLLNGHFGVFHSQVQRAIFDCRPANSGELRLPWTRLPNGPMLVRLRIRRGQGLRGSGDDLGNFFYQLTEAPGDPSEGPLKRLLPAV